MTHHQRAALRAQRRLSSHRHARRGFIADVSAALLTNAVKYRRSRRSPPESHEIGRL